jgi:hypothetical protein
MTTAIYSPHTVEQALLDNMLSAEQVGRYPMNTMSPFQRVRIWMVAVVMIAAGVILMWRLPDHRLVLGLSEALIIAGLLALIVDPLLKRNLLVEASKGIFIHLLGFEHHPQVKDKLKEIVFKTTILRTRLQTVLTVEPQADGFLLTVEYESDLINPTNTPISYEPSIEWDMAHKPQLPRMSLTSSDGEVKWTLRDVVLEENEPGVQEAKPRRVRLQPSSKGVTYHGSGTYKIFTKHGYFITYTGLPTLKTCTRVNIPDDYELSATRADVKNDNYWEWNNIQMLGDHTTIRWRKRGGEWL